MLFTQEAMVTGNLDALKDNAVQELRNHKGKYILQGALFIILGIVAAIVPITTAFSIELLIGAVLLLSGIAQFVISSKAGMHRWSLLSACLSVIIGIVMIAKPFAGLLALITLIAFFMTVEGIFELLLAIQFRHMRNYGWMLFSGIVTFLLAMVLWIGFPTLDVLYLGWIIAINFIFYGLSLMMLVWRVTP